MKQDIKNILKNYYLAYKHANGLSKAKTLRLRYNKGWIRVNGDSYRVMTILDMTKTLLDRKAKFE